MPDEASFPSYIVRNQRPVMNQNVAILRKCASLLFTFTRLELVVGLLTHYNLGACPIKDVDFACTSLWKCGQCYFVPLKSATPLYLFLSWGGDTWLPTTTKTLFQHMMSYLVPIDSLLVMTSLEMKDDIFCEFALN